MRLRLALAAVVTLAGVGPGWAEPLPAYPVDDLCATISGGKPAWLVQCVQGQQAAHDALEYGDVAGEGTFFRWNDVPAQIQVICIYTVEHPFALKQPYSYSALEGCINAEYTKSLIAHPKSVPHFQP